MRSLVLMMLLTLQALAQPGLIGSDVTVTARPPDTLASLARHHGLGLEHLAFANRLPVGMAPVSASALVIPLRRILPRAAPTEGLVLNLPERGLYHFRAGRCEGFYPVAIGMPGWFTPVGSYQVQARTAFPSWLPPAWAGGGPPVPPGPANPLGDRWLGFHRGYGLHGTNRPDSIGGAVSHGCVRMYPEHIRQLFERVTVGTSLRIDYEPVKLGSADDLVYLAVFPDVYGRADLLGQARSLLAAAGLEQLVDPERLRAVVSRASGRAEPLLGEELSLEVDGLLQTPRFVGLRQRGTLYVPAELLEPLGVSTQGVEALVYFGRRLVPAVRVLAPAGFAARSEKGCLRLTRRPDSPPSPGSPGPRPSVSPG